MNTNKPTNTMANQFKNVTTKITKASKKLQFMGIVFIILFVIIIAYLLMKVTNDYRQLNTNEPWLVRQTKIARVAKSIPGHLIKPSTDGQFGIEFSYAMWIYITDWTYKNDEYKHILHKGNNSAMPLQAPGIWLYPKENKIAINMNTFYSVKESCDIGNIPIGKWFHLTVVVIGKNMDVYVNGNLKKRCEFKGVPKQNYGDVYINLWGGFDGFLSKVRYFNYSLPYFKIEQIVSDGPSQAPCVDSNIRPPYFAKDWWMTTGFPNAVGYPN